MNHSSPNLVLHVAHVINRFAVGGMENGLVNLINHLPEDRYHHSVICLDSADEEFVSRLKTTNFEIHCIHKTPGKGYRWLYETWHLLRRLRPDILHTRNLGCLEAQLAQFRCGISASIHGEHGWDVADPEGTRLSYRYLRKAISPLVDKFVPLSGELEDYLSSGVGIRKEKIVRICNGVDIERFRPPEGFLATRLGPQEFSSADSIVFGTVGRLEPIKNQMYLVEAFIGLVSNYPEIADRVRLLIVGDGSLAKEIREKVESAGIERHTWLAGSRNDVTELMQMMDVFVLPSLAEGISNTILEAMATGLPVIATDVGGNPDLIPPGKKGANLVAVNDISALTGAMAKYCANDTALMNDSVESREHCEKYFSLRGMIENYDKLYTSSILVKPGC